MKKIQKKLTLKKKTISKLSPEQAGRVIGGKAVIAIQVSHVTCFCTADCCLVTNELDANGYHIC